MNTKCGHYYVLLVLVLTCAWTGYRICRHVGHLLVGIEINQDEFRGGGDGVKVLFSKGNDRVFPQVSFGLLFEHVVYQS